jgi:hypothetical protein
MLSGVELVGITGGGWLVGGATEVEIRVGFTTIAVGNEKVGKFVGRVTGTVVGTPLVESGVRVGCPVVCAVALWAISSSEGAPDRLHALTTSANTSISANKRTLRLAIRDLSFTSNLPDSIANRKPIPKLVTP